MALLTQVEHKPHLLGSICEDLVTTSGGGIPAPGTEQPKEEPKVQPTVLQQARQYWNEANEATGGWLPYIVGAGAGYVWLKKRNKK